MKKALCIDLTDLRDPTFLQRQSSYYSCEIDGIYNQLHLQRLPRLKQKIIFAKLLSKSLVKFLLEELDICLSLTN